MKTRFRKVWCAACRSMQFAGECPHGRVVALGPGNPRDFHDYYRLAKSDCHVDRAVPLTAHPERRR